MNFKRAYIHVFLMIALVMAGVSPACKFISGKSLMEICGADGSVKTAEIPLELAGFIAADNAPESDQGTDHVAPGETCAFCFTASNFKPLGAAVVQVFMPVRTAVVSARKEEAQTRSAYNAAHQPRGPPADFS